MPARRLALALALALVAPVLLAACDSGADTSAVAGVWEGNSHFEIDTLITASNVRVRANYDVTYRFELAEEDGLVSGRILASAVGTRTVREAGPGFPTDTLRLNTTDTPRINDLVGTFVDPTLEVDVPEVEGEESPYDAGLWTFTVEGGRAEIASDIILTDKIMLRNGTEISVNLKSPEAFVARQLSEGLPEAARTAVARLTGRAISAAAH